MTHERLGGGGARVSSPATQAMLAEIQGLASLLERWKRMPDAPPSEFSPFSYHDDRHHRFSEKEISRMRDDLRRMSPASYYSVFPEDLPGRR